MPGGEAPACPAGEPGAQIVSGLETQMLPSEGHALREEGLVRALISRGRVSQLREQLPQRSGWQFVASL